MRTGPPFGVRGACRWWAVQDLPDGAIWRMVEWLVCALRFLAGPDGQHDGGGLAAFGELFGCQADSHEGVYQGRERQVGGADLVPHAPGGPGCLGPVPVPVTGPDHDGGGIAAVSEPAAEAGVHADVHEPPARGRDPGGFGQHRRVGGHVGVRHHGDDGRQTAVADWQPRGVGLDGGQA